MITRKNVLLTDEEIEYLADKYQRSKYFLPFERYVDEIIESSLRRFKNEVDEKWEL